VIGFVIIVGISDTTAEHIETYGIVSAIVDLFAIIGFLVFAPYVIHRLIVKRKL
jgi:flagellar biogenesis protein FliO